MNAESGDKRIKMAVPGVVSASKTEKATLVNTILRVADLGERMSVLVAHLQILQRFNDFKKTRKKMT